MASDNSLQSTRQMLDELDALMERMLALPVNDLEGAPPFPKDIVQTPALSATLTLLDPPAAPPQPEPAFLEHPPLNAPHLAFSLATTQLPPLPAEPAPLSNDVEPPSAMPELAPLLAPTPDLDAAPDFFSPLVWVNQAFDAVSAGLLRGPAGRALVGLSGLAMLAVAVGWFLKDFLGWSW